MSNEAKNPINIEHVKEYVAKEFKSTIIPSLMEYIKIPNQSPAYDKDYATNGHQDKAVKLIEDWVKEQKVEGLHIEVHREKNRTPLIFMTIEGEKSANDKTHTILMYGHMDKQPPMTEAWSEGLGPFTPVIRDDKLYGRGGADDGYSAFAAITAVKAVKQQKLPHARIVILIEACEESGSFDLPFYIQKLSDQIGIPSLVICLDSGCGDYNRLWITTSLRGLVLGTLKAHVLTEAVHSGMASGIVPSSFRTLRHAIEKLEDVETGRLKSEDCYVKIPDKHMQYAKLAAEVLGKEVYSNFPWHENTSPMSESVEELLLNRTWGPTVSVTGLEGIPSIKDGGNVLRPQTLAKLSIRLPPTCDPQKAAESIKSIMEAKTLHNSTIKFEIMTANQGWAMPILEKWLEDAIELSSKSFWGHSAMYWGEGGGIPFMNMLVQKYPKAQFVVTGVLGPKSNAHGPNEFMHIPMTQNIVSSIALILAHHHHHGLRKQ